MDPVLFTSQRHLDRAENIKAVYNAYNGAKAFFKLDWYRRSPAIESGAYDIMVTDEIPVASPGTVVMINHGISGTKLYGLDQPRPYATRLQCDLIDYVITQSPELIEQVAKQQGVSPEQVKPLGMPRTDAYIGKTKGQGGTGLNYKRVYLYTPTYRTQREQSKAAIDWGLLNSLLTDDELFIIKPHMLTKRQVAGDYDHIKEVSSAAPSTPYLIDCDVLITDYSSFMLDGLAAKKPVVLFSKDNVYLEARGMYFKYPDAYASYFCNNERELVDTLRRAAFTDADAERARFFVPTCDGHSTERVVDFIRSLEK